MHELLPESGAIRIYQKPGKLGAAVLEPVDQLLLILPRRPGTKVWSSLPHGDKLSALAGKRPADALPSLQTRLPNKRQTWVVAGTIKPDADAFERLTVMRRLVAALLGEKAGSLGIVVAGFDEDVAVPLYEAALAAALAAAFALPSFKKKPPPARIRTIRLLGADKRLDTSRIEAEASGNNLARWLTSLPPNKLDARTYARLLKTMASDRGWEFERLGTRELGKLGAGAFLAVAQGNDDDSASIVRLRYRPGKKTAKPEVGLVGKGIVFDTGGTNLKPFASMLEMHGDMQGSAVALGTLVAISELELPIAVDCWLAITENRIGPRAYKPQDVVTAANGMTIQTIHTDAEGRMALADTLVLASREKPKVLIDYATLTGAVINAITSRYSGVFTNRADWHPRLKRTGSACGERVWPFPIGKEFLADLKSDIADIKQCSPKPSADHILAGSFLAEFVGNDVPWIHVDLAASNHSGGLGHIPSEVTGFGVRYTLSLLLDENICKADN